MWYLLPSLERGRGRGEGDDAAGFGVLRQEEGLAQRRQDARAGNGNRPEKGEGRKDVCLIFLQAIINHDMNDPPQQQLS